MRQQPVPQELGLVSDDSTLDADGCGRDADLLIGSKVGNIRVHRLVGEGGMGAVYAGFDERLRREVALKAVRFDHLAPNSRARLLSEARVLSRLNHPNLCAIYDFVSGETTDFLVLELIHGVNLRQAIARGIPPAERLGIAERIVEALGAAHSQGVIHRDLKPANVMLTPEGGVKVLDFGIARLSEEEPAWTADPDRELTTAFTVTTGEVLLPGCTAPGKVVGTAGCMSPEQARGEPVTVASDLYALGLLFQELFTGEPAYDPALKGFDLLREVQKGRTRPVTGVDRHLAELIEQLKFPSPEGRPTAAETLHRLRWIEEKPRRRNRFLATAAALLLVASGVTKHTLDLGRERDVAVQALRQAEISRRQGDQVVAFLLDLFKVADPGATRGNSVTARELLDEGARRIRDNLQEQPAVRSRMLDSIGQVYYKLGLYRDARPLLEDALRLRERQPAPPLDLADSLEHLAVVDQAENRPEAGPRLQQALRLREAELGHQHPAVASALSNLGIFHARNGEFAKAEELFREALAIREATLGPDHPDVAVSLNNLGMVRSAQNDHRGAEPLLRRGLAIRERVLPPGHPDLAANLEALALVLGSLGRNQDAERLHRRALAIDEKALGPEHPKTLLVLSNLGDCLAGLGKSEEAEAVLRRAIRSRESVLGPDHPDLAITLSLLGDLYRKERRYAEAEPLLRRAVEILEAAYPPGHPTRMSVSRSYAELLRAAKPS